MKLKKLLILTTFALASASAFSHPSFQTKEAQINSTYRAVMGMAHGCKGGLATLQIRVSIPEGVILVKPVPKHGWKVETVVGKYQKVYEFHGRPRTEGVKEIIYTGELPNDYYDEFMFRAYLTDSLQDLERLYFPTVQKCLGTQTNWIGVPVKGQEEMQNPQAPFLLLTAADAEKNH